MSAKVYATYSTCCFCTKPAMETEVVTPYEPRFQFAKAARQLADKLGAVNFQLNTRGSGRSAYAEIPHKCAHFDKQSIRIDWTLVY
jgi:hypothetical protein